MNIGTRIGVGRTAEVFEWEPGKVLKLHYDWVHAEWIHHQVAMEKMALRAGLPCPQVYETMEHDGRLGIVYERVDGRTLLDIIMSSPTSIFRCVQRMAHIHYEIHRASFTEPPTEKNEMKRAIMHSKEQLSDRVPTILKYLDKLPSGQSLCHGDYHPDNILIPAEGTPVVIDWSNATIGNPAYDVARSYITLCTPYGLPENGVLRMIMKGFRRLASRAYIREYKKLSGMKSTDIEAWILPVAAARLRENVPGERDWLMRMIDRRLARV